MSLTSRDGLFQVYVVDWSSYGLGGSKYFIITFRNRGAADLWWRKIEDWKKSASYGYPLRFSPQFYYSYSTAIAQWKTITDNSYDLAIGYRDVGAVPEITPLPPSIRTDYISGKSFCIRSRAKPDLFWSIVVTHSQTTDSHTVRLYLTKSNYPNRFIIERTEANSQGTVMVPGDKVTLRPVTSAGLGSSKLDVSAVQTIPTPNTAVPDSPAVFEFQFGHLTTTGGFFVNGDRDEDSRIIITTVVVKWVNNGS
ncbi:hypothetical protein NP233_g7311 [Leucocoprinus birnbaumii]|uniref:Uncharacterized protein n=1 Tax=Leucocoprinus birnbaumii TaxID=56174 RepID=A0AAD5VPK6_9AGAR|nr:hypothetical protein NP233_g7311 [Leucocoprinus birnbaumii]